MRRWPQSFLITLLFWAGLNGCDKLRADILHLHSGGRLEGEVTPTDQGYRLQQKKTVVHIPWERVKRHERKLLPEEAYAQRLAAVEKQDSEGWFVLGLWCRQNGLTRQAEDAFRHVLQLDPEHRDTRRLLGHQKRKGRWLTVTEQKAQQGLASYQGKWVPKAEAGRRREQARLQQQRRQAGRKGRRVLCRLSKRSSSATQQRAVQQLVDLGPAGADALIYGLSDSCPVVRSVAIQALGNLSASRCIKSLCRRMAREPRLDLTAQLPDALARQNNRAEVLRELVNLLMQDANALHRQRLIYALGKMDDPDVVPLLIPHVAFSPNQQKTDLPEEQAGTNETASKTTEKNELSEEEKKALGIKGRYILKDKDSSLAAKLGLKKQHQPYYPAHEALCALTGQNLGNNVDAWRQWWEGRDEEIDLIRQAIPQRRRVNVQKRFNAKWGLSMRDALYEEER